MLTLHSYPGLFGVADNNPFGLKVFAAMRLGGLAFRHAHISDASRAPRGQLPYLTDGAETVGDSAAIIAHLEAHRGLTLDRALTPARAYNAQRYRYQGIGRFTPEQAYARGIGNLAAVGAQLPAEGFVFGTVPCSLDAAIYGFVANTRFYPTGTPPRAWVLGHPAPLRHCDAIHASIA
ncbi:MAG: glutathione S-transferase N-terminal domain-containing protein [Acetobacteraceae bacterium]|nr:glutathione S-transferase N-terminal domain-containing protein [Acetobacteraceae bacterium]